MTLFIPNQPVHGSWSHHRRRRDCLAALFPPKDSLEHAAILRDLTRYPAEYRRDARQRPDNLLDAVPYTLDMSAVYNGAYSQALAALDALSVSPVEPYAHDYAFATLRGALFAWLQPIPDFADQHEIAQAVLEIFAAGYGCLGIYDGTPYTYLVARGDHDDPTSKKRPRHRTEADMVPAVPGGSGGTSK